LPAPKAGAQPLFFAGNHHDSTISAKFRAWFRFSKAVFSSTVDAGCEIGGGVSCCSDNADSPSQYFVGAMLNKRIWFDHDTFALSFGGGVVSDPGRYLVLTPPINGSATCLPSS
jgi:hypothetical protein